MTAAVWIMHPGRLPGVFTHTGTSAKHYMEDVHP
jgi:hypothetical protein